MITPEEIFFKDLQAYFYSEYEFSDSDKKKILKLLLDYKGKINTEIKIVNKTFVVYKNQSGGYSTYPKTEKKLLSFTELQAEFDKYCYERSIKFINIKKNGRSAKNITKVRAEFCNYAAENFLVSKTELANFFGLNHATIHYYFNPKCKQKK